MLRLLCAARWTRPTRWLSAPWYDPEGFFLVVISATKWMRQMAGTAAPSLAATLVEEALAEGTLTAEHEEDIKGAAGVVYAGECPPFDMTTFAC